MLNATESCLNLFAVVFVRLSLSSVIQIEKHTVVRSDNVPMVVSWEGLVPSVLTFWIRREIIRARWDINPFTAQTGTKRRCTSNRDGRLEKFSARDTPLISHCPAVRKSTEKRFW
jgi:hypothetical protein